MSKKTIFVSYGHNVFDQIVYKLVEDLTNEGFLDVFLDVKYLNVGDWETKIDNAITNCDYFLFFVSKRSVSLDGYCLNELTRAVEKKKIIIPILLDDSFVPLSIVRLQRLMLNKALTPQGELVLSIYDEFYKKLLKIFNGEEVLGKFDDGLDLSLAIHVFDSFEIVHHTSSFVGRELFFNDFEQWINCSDSLPIYLLQASPGIGKTAICSMLTVKYPENVAAVHFCSFNNKIKTDAKNIIKNIAGQIAGRSFEYANELRNIVKKENLSEVDAKRLFELLIIEAGNKISFDRTQVVVIDALDEAIIEGKNEIAETIVSYQNLLPKWLKVLCSTRPQDNVLLYFSNCHRYCIFENNDENISDIKKYYDLTLSNYSFDADKLRVLLRKTHGSFLYAKEIIKNIKSGELSINAVEEFPDGIYSYYKVWFDRIFVHSQNDYEPFKKILSLLLVCSLSPTIDFLSDTLDMEDATLNYHLSKVTSFFIVADNTLKCRHKSILDWLSNRNECPSDYYISKKDGYKLLLSYILEKKETTRRWKKDPYVILDYGKCLKGLNKLDDLIGLLKDIEYVEACLNSSFYSLYEGLYEYINNINFVYLDDEDAAFEIYESNCFTDIFIKYRKHMYNSGLFIKLKESGFSKFIYENDKSDDVDYDLGIIQFLYISLLFKQSYNQLIDFSSKHNLDSLDLDHRSEFERMAMLIYRKLVLFDKIIEIGPITIEDAKKAGNLFEESLACLTLSKVYCRTLEKEKCYKFADKAVELLNKKVIQEEEDGTQIGDHLFLAEDYRVYADACIWHLDLEKAKENLTKAEAIYARYNQHDRYYTRFLYTSLFYEIVSKGEQQQIQNLFVELFKILEESKDKYDLGQANFLKSLYFLVESKNNASLLAKAESPCSEAIEINKALSIDLELLESEALYNVICEKQGISRKYNNSYNTFTDVWINYVSAFIKKLLA